MHARLGRRNWPESVDDCINSQTCFLALIENLFWDILTWCTPMGSLDHSWGVTNHWKSTMIEIKKNRELCILVEIRLKCYSDTIWLIHTISRVSSTHVCIKKFNVIPHTFKYTPTWKIRTSCRPCNSDIRTIRS